MVKVLKDMEIKASEFRQGSSAKGNWMMAQVKADKGYSKIILWVDNCDDVQPANAYKVSEILSVQTMRKKYEKDGETKWFDEVSANVQILPVASSGFAKLNDDDVPF